jgi:hypothetical protein
MCAASRISDRPAGCLIPSPGGRIHSALRGPGVATSRPAPPGTSTKRTASPITAKSPSILAPASVVRLITQTEEKISDVVHQDDERIDYGPVTVGDKSLVLPIRAVTITEVVPNGESGDGGTSFRCTLFTSEYKNYQFAQK